MPDNSLRGHAAGWSSADARQAGAQAAAVLVAAHEAGATHLALTPESILTVPGSKPPVIRLTGFGGTGTGTERNAHSAPEIGGSAAASAAADVYSLGVILAELFLELEDELRDCGGGGPGRAAFGVRPRHPAERARAGEAQGRRRAADGRADFGPVHG